MPPKCSSLLCNRSPSNTRSSRSLTDSYVLAVSQHSVPIDSKYNCRLLLIVELTRSKSRIITILAKNFRLSRNYFAVRAQRCNCVYDNCIVFNLIPQLETDVKGRWKQLCKQLTINHWFYVSTSRSHRLEISVACILSPDSMSNTQSITEVGDILWSNFPSLRCTCSRYCVEPHNPHKL